MSMEKSVPHHIHTLVDLLSWRALVQPEDLLFGYLADGINVSQSLTYQELDEEARKIAAHLQQTCQPGDRAILLFPPGLDYISAYFGCLYAGVIAVPVYPPQMGKQLARVQTIMENATPSMIVANQFVHQAVQVVAPEWMEAQYNWLITDNLSDTYKWKKPELSAEDLAFLQYTSGSTGNPKGVCVSHGNLMSNERMIAKAFLHPGKVIGVNWLPLYHDMGLIGTVIQPIFVGGCSYLMSPLKFLQRPQNWLAAISKYKATSAGAPNFGYELCMRKVSPQEMELLDLSSWQIAFNGAEPVRPDTLARFAEKFGPVGFNPNAYLPCYGLAEATLIVSGDKSTGAYQTLQVDEASFRSHQIVPKADGQIALVGSGQVCEPDSVKIVHPNTGRLCTPDQIGEVWVRGPHVAKGYWNNPEVSERTFGAYIADTGEGPFMRTGDLGFLYQGELFITGRAKDLIIIRGKNHYPQDIELSAEHSHPDLQPGGTAAFSLDRDGEEKVVIVQEIQKGALKKTDPQEIFQAIRHKVTQAHQIPLHAVVLVKRRSLKKTSSGKIQRHANKLAFERGELKVEAAWYQPGEAQDATQSQTNVAIHLNKEALSQWVVEWLSQKLSLSPEKIDLGDPLSAYGIDSLMLAEFEVEISDFLGKQWPVRDLLLTEPSIEELAERGMEFVKETV